MRRLSRVVFCVQNLPVPKDPRVWREATALAARGYDVAVISPGDARLPRRELRDNVEILRYRTLPPLRGVFGYLVETLNALVWTLLLGIRLRRRGAIDALHAANPPDTFFLVALALRPFGTKFVFDQHDLAPEMAFVKWGHRRVLGRVMGRLMRVLEAASYRSADLVIAPNNSYRRIALHRGHVEPSKVVVVRNGPEAAERAAFPGSITPLVVAYAGTMNAQDGLPILLDAVSLVEARRPGSIRLDLIGSGEEVSRLRQRAETLGISSLLTWAGWLTGEAYTSRLHSAHVGVSPDPDDPFTRASTMIKVAEYVAGGLPSIIADIPENRVTAGDAAVYFQPGSAADLARCIEGLIDTPDRLEELACRARERGPLLVWENSARRLAVAYDWLFQQGPPVAGDQVVVI